MPVQVPRKSRTSIRTSDALPAYISSRAKPSGTRSLLPRGSLRVIRIRISTKTECFTLPNCGSTFPNKKRGPGCSVSKCISQSMQPTYCGLCDMWFSTERSFNAHLTLNEKHPSCDKCDRRFADRLAYFKHLVLSPKHHYCSHCGTDHNSALELRAHVEHAAAHANWRSDHEADMDWAGHGSTMTSVGSTATRRSSEDEGDLSIFDCYGDHRFHHSLRGQFQIERDLAN